MGFGLISSKFQYLPPLESSLSKCSKSLPMLFFRFGLIPSKFQYLPPFESRLPKCSKSLHTLFFRCCFLLNLACLNAASFWRWRAAAAKGVTGQ
ncbi:hypothetical protein QL285_028651 [Trifolium repens]|nr:hypothetical protein QL285_028651 [Trifolium repens]